MYEAAKAREMAEQAKANASAPVQSRLPRLITIQLDADGRVTLEGRPVSTDDLLDQLKAIRKQEKDNRVEATIHVDQECHAGHLLLVTDALSTANITPFRIVDAAEIPPATLPYAGGESAC